MIIGALAPIFAPVLLFVSPIADASDTAPILTPLVAPAANLPNREPAATATVPAGAVEPISEADIVVSAKKRGSAPDPLRAINEKSFEATVAVDDAVAKPIALAYAKAVPEPLRDGLRNALDNLSEPVTFINYLLQLKPVSALRTVARFAINSVVGVGGLFNMAKRKPFHLQRRRNGFANTLGYYGVGHGAFFYVPLIGPTTLRDLVGGLVDGAFLPTAVGRPFTSVTYTVPVGLLSAVDRRERNDEKILELRQDEDPYAAARRSYVARRRAEIDALRTRGKP